VTNGLPLKPRCETGKRVELKPVIKIGTSLLAAKARRLPHLAGRDTWPLLALSQRCCL